MPPAPQRKEVGAFTESFTVAQRGSVCGTECIAFTGAFEGTALLMLIVGE
jgi:hypothetical protein